MTSHDTLADPEAAEAAALKTDERAREVLVAAVALTPGDLVIHVEHGLGRFERMVSLSGEVDPTASQDAVEIAYKNGKIFVPASDLGLLSRYGSAQSGARLDRIGGRGWPVRRERAIRKIDAIARRLIGIAAERVLAKAPAMKARKREYARLVQSVPYELTPDQTHAIADVEQDLASGRPMDRLVCGDVGSGKTEVALRAAFIAAKAGFQVAVVVPTTLLARQHTETFRSRLAGTGIRIEHASRLSGASGTAETRRRLAEGSIDIAIGTHTLLAEGIRFERLGLLVIDEEQRFGVQHKERLKQLREGVHVLTLTATPIPRTMQLALSPVRDLSLILTPPSGRRAIETAVGTAQSLPIAEALEAEKKRGGQSFYVCPRIADLGPIAAHLAALVPGLGVAMAHGRMPATELDRIMQAFARRRFDILLSTTIVESGLDVPNANTLVVHDAHRLGLAQLYQLRGRVGRSTEQAFAFLTLPADKEIGETARRRLSVLADLDSVGAGFAIASHDMDIRGAGNLLGEEQSGHIKDIGFDLFQTLLNRAVAAKRKGEARGWSDIWVPRLALGIDTRIPGDFILDVGERLDVYWRLAQLETEVSIDALQAEVQNGRGALPKPVKRLFELARLKVLCRELQVIETQAGPRGAVFTPRTPTPIARKAQRLPLPSGTARIKRNGQLLVSTDFRDEDDRIAGLRRLLESLSAHVGHPTGRKERNARRLT